MKIYVINLERSHERRERMIKALTDAGLEYEIFPAVDGSKNFEELEHYNDKKRRFLRSRPLTRGELAAFASHHRLWKKCVELNEPIIIFEDDAVLLPEFPEAIKIAEQHIEKYGCLRFYGHRGGEHKTLEILDGGFRIDFSRKGVLGSVAYMLSPDAASKFLSHSTEWIFGQDIYMNLSYLHKVGCFMLKPYSIDHSWEDTTIHGRSGHKKKLVSKIIKELHVASIRIRSSIFEYKMLKNFRS
ncbi:glycosyltransferase family 25 protein [Halodesulfovibrio marinisediminis]|uniref:Glycosyl transferase, family 25 n=1 Tax=Halodesulfovibrio marinisediminis DSM 17456 TaxID=1121457 RepID=A0A1N6H4A3_9BACT|nr:glycosyltransferase family 25 protein [Halodesulfovibrio marinisediminis]SIO14552.1 glycosyl transferase, family 25 [Halodesulfovibrio marinisediminis DSM 17456]